jgi:hypothetical protein
MAFFRSTAGRLLLIGLFLTTTTLSAGYLADALHYPSLWGSSSSVWIEYTVPLPYYWAFSHLVSMLPLALLVGSFPLWPQVWIVRVRWILLFGLVAIFFAEVKLPYGRLRHVPYFLFIAVDLALALLCSLLVFRTRRLLAVIGTIVVILLIAAALLRQALEPEQPGRKPEIKIDLSSAAPSTSMTPQFFEEVRSYERGKD